MEYEIVALEEKNVVGLKAKTKNSDPDMGAVIGKLWKDFFEGGTFFQIPGKRNEKSIGLYTNYESDVHGFYDVFVCCETDGEEIPMELSHTQIPAGKYAKFILRGNTQTVVSDFWGKLWGMDLNRAYTADFEEYQPGGDMENAEVHVFISLK